MKKTNKLLTVLEINFRVKNKRKKKLSETIYFLDVQTWHDILNKHTHTTTTVLSIPGVNS